MSLAVGVRWAWLPPHPAMITADASGARTPSLRAIMGRSASVAELPKWARELLEHARVGRLGLLDDEGGPRVLPVTYALSAGALVSAVDHKAKAVPSERLARVRWLTARPRAALTVDHYEEDWSRLAWVQAIGEVSILAPRSRRARRARRALPPVPRPRAGRSVPLARARPLRLVASLGRYALGAAGLAVICAALSFAAVAIRRRALADWTGAPARLAETVIGLALLIGILELLGAVGLFAFVPVLAASVLAALLARRWASLRSASLPDDLAAGPKGEAGMPSGPSPRAGRPVRSGTATTTAWLATVLALLAAATVLAEWGALSIQSYNVGIRGFDSLWYHLPWAASFAQTGNVVSLRFTDVEYLTPFYPATAEMLHGLGIVLLGRDTLSPGFNLVWLALTLLAAYCIGRPRGVGAATLLGAALATATTMMDYSQAGAAANDIVAVFFLLAAVALLMTAPEQRAALVLAAVAAGLAVGVKLTVLAPVLALTIGVVAIAPRGRRRATAGLWLGPLILAGGFWYARNLIAVGNPIPWTSLRGVLPTPTPALQQHTGFSVAHYLGSIGSLWSRSFEPALASGLGRWWWAVLAVAVAGPLLCLLPKRGSGRKGECPFLPKHPLRCSAQRPCSPSRPTSSPPRPPPGPPATRSASGSTCATWRRR